MLSATELSQLEAELEKDLEAAEVCSRQEPCDASHHELFHSIQAGLKDASDSESDDGIEHIPAFELLTQSKTSIDYTRKNSLALVQNIKTLLIQSNDGGGSENDSEGNEPLDRLDTPEVTNTSRHNDDQRNKEYPIVEEESAMDPVASPENLLLLEAMTQCNQAEVMSVNSAESLGTYGCDSDSNDEDTVRNNLNHVQPELDMLLEEAADKADRNARIIGKKT